MRERDPHCNVTESIASKIGVNLHQQQHHPLHIIKTTIERYFDGLHREHGCVACLLAAVTAEREAHGTH